MAKSVGAVRQLLEMLVSQKNVLCEDAYGVSEARRNLSAKAPAESLRMIDELIARIEVSATNIVGSDKGIVSWLPEKDRPLLVAAMKLGCDALITSDITHFGAGFGKLIDGLVAYLPRQLASAVLLRSQQPVGLQGNRLQNDLAGPYFAGFHCQCNNHWLENRQNLPSPISFFASIA